MARGKTLLELRNSLRAECRLSLNPAHNVQVNDHQTIYLQRAQEDLWSEFAWPHLRVEREVPAQAGQRFYAPPSDVKLDRIEKIQFRYGGVWQDLVYGVGAEQYQDWDSETGVRSWPVCRWRIFEDEQIEVWPIPALDRDPLSLDGTLKIIGIRDLQPLVKDDDRADLDEWLIVLPVAVRLLAASGKKEDNLLLGQAQNRLQRLRGELTKTRSFQLFGGDRSQERDPWRNVPRVQYRVGP